MQGPRFANVAHDSVVLMTERSAEAMEQERADAAEAAWVEQGKRYHESHLENTRLRAALARIIEIVEECPTWWDDPSAGIGAIARAALEPAPAGEGE